MKNKIFILITIIILLFTSGCSLVADNVVDKNGELKLTAIEKKDIAYEQMYIKNNDKYYPALVDYDSRLEQSDKPSNNRLIFLQENDVLIPTLYSDDELIFNTIYTAPNLYEFERFEDDGYTIGLYNIYVSEDHKRYGFSSSLESNVVENSSFHKLMKEFGEDTYYFILGTFNKTEDLSTLLTNGKTIKGLNYNKSYEIEFFLGSQYINEKIKADIHAFTSVELFSSDKYKFTKENVIKVTLPKDLKNGYYLINDIYFIRYCNKKREEGMKDINFNENINNQGGYMTEEELEMREKINKELFDE